MHAGVLNADRSAAALLELEEQALMLQAEQFRASNQSNQSTSGTLEAYQVRLLYYRSDYLDYRAESGFFCI